jgi:hypothetical protein
MNQINKPFRFKENQPVTWFHRVETRSNQYCLYCHRPVCTGDVVSNKEHLIGRSFIPDGSLSDGAFNFIFRACVECNTEKAELERHISSVSLFTSLGRVDENLSALAKRKASTDFHPIQKGKLVKDASTEQSIELARGNLRINFGLVGPPQLDPSYVKLLAFRHIQGFFSLITSEDPTVAEGTRLLMEDHWWFGGSYPHSDWGNVRIKEMAQRVKTWETPLNIETANGFFKIVIRCAPSTNGPWFWALEWNKSWRVFGGIFDIHNFPTEFSNLPIPERMQVAQGRTIYKNVRIEDYEDNLFWS